MFSSTEKMVPTDSMQTPDSLADPRSGGAFARQSPEMNDALLVSSEPQHELAEQATKAEEALRVSEARLQSALDAAEMGTWNIDPVTQLFTCDERFRKIFGTTIEGLTVDQAVATVHPEDRVRVDEVVSAAMRPEAPVPYDVEYRVIHPDESVHWVSAKGHASYSQRAKTSGLLSFAGTVSDITSRKQAEADLKAKSDRLHLLWEAASVLISADEPDAMLHVLLDKIGNSLGVDTCFNYIVTDSRSKLKLESYIGISEETALSMKYLEFGHAICGKVASTLEPIVATYIQLSEEPLVQLVKSIGLRTYTCYPLISGTDFLGTLSFGSRTKDYFEPDELVVLQTISQYVAAVYGRREAANTLRDSEMRYRRLFQTAKDGILILDAGTGKITAANAFMSELTGEDSQKLIGRQLYEIGMFKDVAENQTAFHQLQETKYLRIEDFSIFNSKEDNVEVEVIANIYQEGERSVAQCNIRDVRQRMRLEREIIKHTEALAEESRRKDEFLAMLSHELRNPLAPIRSAVHVLRTHEHVSQSPVNRHALDIMERQVGNLTKLVSDLMEISRVVSGRIRIDLQAIEVNHAIEQAVLTVASLTERKRHTVTVQAGTEEIWVEADPTRFEEVLVNLLNNAAKFTPEGGRILVYCELDGKHVKVGIRDNGIGIDKDLLPRIFDLFTQGDRSLDRSEGGLGIGLNLAHRLTEMQGGTISVQSPPRGQTVGTEFTVRFPQVPSPVKVPVVPQPVEVPHSFSLRVLVVEDNRDLANLLKIILEDSGFTVQAAFDGPAGLAIAQQWRPDVVLLDIGLPGLDGFEVAKILSAEFGASMKLIALSGYGSSSDLEMATASGFSAHLTKPFEISDLEKLMASLTV